MTAAHTATALKTSDMYLVIIKFPFYNLLKD